MKSLTLNQKLHELNHSTCDHPGCNELYGADDAREELIGTQWEKDITGYINHTIQKSQTENNELKKLVLLEMAEAAIKGEGFREANRKMRYACIHYGLNE